jgi:hypothetical protein
VEKVGANVIAASSPREDHFAGSSFPPFSSTMKHNVSIICGVEEKTIPAAGLRNFDDSGL